jgi:hypothetical protein
MPLFGVLYRKQTKATSPSMSTARSLRISVEISRNFEGTEHDVIDYSFLQNSTMKILKELCINRPVLLGIPIQLFNSFKTTAICLLTILLLANYLLRCLTTLPYCPKASHRPKSSYRPKSSHCPRSSLQLQSLPRRSSQPSKS